MHVFWTSLISLSSTRSMFECAEKVWSIRIEEEAGNASPPSGPITVLMIRVAATCSYIFEGVHVNIRRRLWCRARTYTERRFDAEA